VWESEDVVEWGMETRSETERRDAKMWSDRSIIKSMLRNNKSFHSQMILKLLVVQCSLGRNINQSIKCDQSNCCQHEKEAADDDAAAAACR